MQLMKTDTWFVFITLKMFIRIGYRDIYKWKMWKKQRGVTTWKKWRITKEVTFKESFVKYKAKIFAFNKQPWLCVGYHIVQLSIAHSPYWGLHIRELTLLLICFRFFTGRTIFRGCCICGAALGFLCRFFDSRN